MRSRKFTINVLTRKTPIIIDLTPDILVEDILIIVCKKLQISPITRHLFGLQYNNSCWYALNIKVWDSKLNSLDFRLRFKVPNFDKLRTVDPVAFNYYYFQVREDVLQSRVSSINNGKYEKELLGLAVTDMYREIRETEVDQSYVLNNYKKYIPKEVLRSHLFFLKKPLSENLSLIMQKYVIDTTYIKSGYLEQFDGIAPSYLIEEYRAVIAENTSSRNICIRVDPFSTEMPGLQYTSLDKKEWVHGCSIEDLCSISLRSLRSIEISRKTGIPLHISFNSFDTTMSFVSLLDGYYRLSVKWTFNLCKDFSIPSIIKLKKMKCHGPVGSDFAYLKLGEKRNYKPGCFILRESENSFNNYFMDVCIPGSAKKVSTYCISLKADGTYWFSCDKKSYKSIQALIETYRNGYMTPSLLEIIPPSEYEESNLLLCCSSKGKTDQSIKTSSDNYMLTECIHPKNLQIFRGSLIESKSGFTLLNKCLWKKDRKSKMEVALKSLRPHYYNSHMKDFMKLASDWSLLKSPSFVNLIGVTLCNPVAMVTEYFPLGQLDKYLIDNKTIIKEVDLVEAATYLANALWMMEEENIAHGYVRCKKLLVASHTDKSFCVRLCDPGIHESFSEEDFHWIPPELFSYPELARSNIYADIWAFGTTLWEIFSYGQKPSFCNINDDSRLSFDVKQNYRSGYRLPCPKQCPTDVYNLMIDCWHPDPDLRKRPQAAIRDINQILFQVFNSRLSHPYATIPPSYKSKSASCDTLNELSSEAIDECSLKSMSTQLSSLSCCENISESWNMQKCQGDLMEQLDISQVPVYGSPDLSSILSNFDFEPSTIVGGISSLQSIFELNQDVNVVLQGKIGQGFYGEVYKGLIEDRNISSEPQCVAVKRLKVVENPSWITDFEREIEIMKKLKHPNIVQMKGVILDPEVNLFMEYVEHGSLQCYLAVNKDRLDPQRHILKYALDVAKGMEYLGEMKIVHRDLAARNVLVTDEFNVKISDFGLAQFLGASNYYISQSNRELPIKWFAPESLRFGKFSAQSDVWSYGITLYEMFTFGEEPVIESFQDSSMLLEALDRGIRLPRPAVCPNEVYVNLMSPCWSSEAKHRPSFSEIIKTVKELSQVE